MINLYSSKVHPRRVFPNNSFVAGITKYDKGGDNSGNFAFSRGADIHSNPREIQILPASVKESGTITQGLQTWGEHVFGNVYFIDNKGNIYQRNYDGSHVLMHTAPNSRGNGLAYYGEDFFLYFINNSSIGRYGPIQDTSIVYETWKTGLDLTVWNNWGGSQVTVTNKQLVVTSTLAAGYYGVEITSYDLTGKFVQSQVLSVGSRTLTSWEVYPAYVSINNSNQLFWYIDNTNVLRAYKKVAGANTILASGTYSPGTHRYFRIREDSGNIYFDYSSDLYIWTQFATTANPFAITKVLAGQYAGTFNTEVATTQALFGLWSTGVLPATAQFVDDYFGSQGGVPQNTGQLNLIAASSQYASHADQAALQITGDIAMEIYVTAASLPAVGSSMTLMGKWNETGNLRAYKFDIFSISGYFGSGADGALTISVNTTDAPIDSVASGKAGDVVLGATNASFAIGQKILIIQMQGVGAGQYEVRTINGYTAGTITLDAPLKYSYAGVAQVLVVKQYTNVTVNTGITWKPKAWNGSLGGILAFLATGTITVNGTIDASGQNQSGSGAIVDGGGFRGGAYSGINTHQAGFSGEGVQGPSVRGATTTGGNGGGAGPYSSSTQYGSGSGGEYAGGATAGATQSIGAASVGIVVGLADQSLLYMGGGGGSGANSDNSDAGLGGNGGAIVFAGGATLIISSSGSILSNGGNGGNATVGGASSGGASGAGGSINLNAQSFTNAGTISAAPGVPGAGQGGRLPAGKGGYGRVTVSYLNAYTLNSESPAATVIQSNNLVTAVTTQLRLGISNDGTAAEYLTINANIPIGVAQRLGVSWKAAASQANFFVSGKNIGVATGSKTAIANKASDFTIGANNNGSAVANFFDGQLDDGRLWNTQRTNDQMLTNLNTQLGGNEFGLAWYGKFNGNLNDSTATANNLTGTNSPTFVTTVPFPAAATRQDIDQSYLQTAVGTYTVPTVLTEADLQSFVPAKDPQKSLDIDIAATGAGNWTVVVHDGLNREVARVTIPNAQLHTGFQEFIYANAFRPVVGATYHFHVFSSAGSGTINTKTAADPTTIRFHTYYQFLVNDLYHPAMQVGNVLAIGNERYVAVQDAAGVYNNQRLRFPSGWHVRCMAKWRHYYAFGCWKGTNISDFDQGMIFLWDGFSVTYNDFIEVPQGGINAMAGMGDYLYFVAGYRGKIMRYDGNSAPVQVRQIPKADRTTIIDILPGAMTVWDNMVRIGVALSSTNGNIQRGVYTLGHNFGDEPEALTMDYVISSGNYDSGVKIGALIAANTNLLIGWGNSSSFGVDAVDPSGNPAAAATIEANVNDFGIRWKEKLALVIRADFKPLKAGESVNVKYRFGYNGAWISTQGNSNITQAVGDSVVRLPLSVDADANGNSGNHHEIQIAVDMAQTANTSPTLLEYGVYEDLLLSEEENQY